AGEFGKVRRLGTCLSRDTPAVVSRGDRPVLQRQDIRPKPGSHSLCKGIIIGWQQPSVQSAFDFLDPLVVEIVVDPGIRASPVVHWHGSPPAEIVPRPAHFFSAGLPSGY